MVETQYTTREVAKLLGIEQSTVVRWCQQGRLPGAQLLWGSRRLGYRIPQSALDALLVVRTEFNAAQPLPR